MLKKLKRYIRSLLIGFPIHGRKLDLSKLNLFYMEKNEKVLWEKRIADVVSCPDNAYIPRHKDAGNLIANYIVLHNGLKIAPLSYCGYPMLRIFMENKGVHEPQEERVFQEILKKLPENSTMIELGSYWSFYSMWFKTAIQNAHSYMIEPNESCLELGKKNFKINKIEGEFFNYGIGEVDCGKSSSITLDTFIEENEIDFVHILHSDIQGQEYNMLIGIQKSIQQKKIGYFVLSTHSNELHYKCKTFLENHKFIAVASADMDQTFSYDGLLVMRAPYFKGINGIDISKKDSNQKN